MVAHRFIPCNGRNKRGQRQKADVDNIKQDLRQSTYILLFIATGALWLLFSILCDGATFIVCPSKLIYNIACPGCGTTHAAKLLLSGQIFHSIYCNPNALLLIVFAVIYTTTALRDYMYKNVIGVTFHKLFNDRVKRIAIPTVLLLELAIWIKNIVS